MNSKTCIQVRQRNQDLDQPNVRLLYSRVCIQQNLYCKFDSPEPRLVSCNLHAIHVHCWVMYDCMIWLLVCKETIPNCIQVQRYLGGWELCVCCQNSVLGEILNIFANGLGRIATRLQYQDLERCGVLYTGSSVYSITWIQWYLYRNVTAPRRQ